MKPIDYIEEQFVRTEDDISPHNVDEKLELRKSIKKRCRSWVIITFITTVIFAVIGTIFLVDHSYLMAAVVFSIAFYWGYFGYAYYRVSRASTAREMQHHLDKLFWGPFYIGDEPPIRGLFLGAAAALFFGLENNHNWYVTPLVCVVIIFLTAVLFWSWRKYELGNYPQDDEIDKEIEKLQGLEEG